MFWTAIALSCWLISRDFNEPEMAFYTYLLASGPYGTLYCGHTDNLTARIGQHREHARAGFTRKYGVDRLVWFEPHDSRSGAFTRERQIKTWNRDWKIRMIEEVNPTWADLYESLQGPLSRLGSPPSRG